LWNCCGIVVELLWNCCGIVVELLWNAAKREVVQQKENIKKN
jgi:hypothetical protein